MDEQKKFCAADPDGPGPATGKSVVEEDLRQICLFKVSEKWSNKEIDRRGELFGYSHMWWKYVAKFWKDCTKTGTDFTDFTATCSYATMDYLAADTAAVKKCVSEEMSSRLSKEIRNHAWSPLALRINGWRYSGPLDPVLVTRSICGGFLKRPAECEYYRQALMNQGGGGLSLFKVFLCLVMVVAVFMAGFGVYKRYLTSSVRHALREEVINEVRNQMADYAPLEDGPSKGLASGGAGFGGGGGARAAEMKTFGNPSNFRF